MHGSSLRCRAPSFAPARSGRMPPVARCGRLFSIPHLPAAAAAQMSPHPCSSTKLRWRPNRRSTRRRRTLPRSTPTCPVRARAIWCSPRVTPCRAPRRRNAFALPPCSSRLPTSPLPLRLFALRRPRLCSSTATHSPPLPPPTPPPPPRRWRRRVASCTGAGTLIRSGRPSNVKRLRRHRRGLRKLLAPPAPTARPSARLRPACATTGWATWSFVTTSWAPRRPSSR